MWADVARHIVTVDVGVLGVGAFSPNGMWTARAGQGWSSCENERSRRVVWLVYCIYCGIGIYGNDGIRGDVLM